MKNFSCKAIPSLVVLALSAFCVTSEVYASRADHKVKEAIDSVADHLKNMVDKAGDDFAAFQNYLDNYHWKGLIEDKATSGVITLSDLTLNGHNRVVAVHPGERIKGEVCLGMDQKHYSNTSFYRVVLGFKGEGGQTTIGNSLGAFIAEGREKFTLTAPTKPGLYQLRFRTVEALLESSALYNWVDVHGEEPDATTTIGIVYVKS